MPVTRKAVVLSLLFVLCDPCLAQGQDFADVNYGLPDEYGPWKANETSFDDLLDHPNATSNFALPGPNVSLAYPKAPAADQGWSWTISVTDDIPAGDFFGATDETRNKVFTGSRLRLNGPSFLNTTAKNTSGLHYDDWHLCVLEWRWESLGNMVNASYPDKLRQDNGSCSSIVSSQCRQDWEAAAVKGYNSGTGQCSPPVLRDISSCGGADMEVLGKLNAVSHYFNSSQVSTWPDGHHDVVGYGGELHDKGNLTAYSKTASLLWPVMVLWGSWPVEQYQGHPNQLTRVNTWASLSCPRALTATEGSASPSWNGTSTSEASKARVISTLPWLALGALLYL